MAKKSALCALGLFSALCALPHSAYAALDCSGLPTTFTGNEFPKGDFFKNFDNSCYTIEFEAGVGHGKSKGDKNSVYNTLYFKVDPRYELIVVAEFPQARYMDVTLNDDHSAFTQTILDANITPLKSTYVNPLVAGATYVPNQKYAVPIYFGGTPGAEQKGCLMTGYNVDANMLDATQRHQGLNWNLDPGFHAKFPQVANHQVDTPTHSNPNTAGSVFIRNYLDITPVNSNTTPHLIVRDVASGCAYPKAYVMSTLMNVGRKTEGLAWLQHDQISDHNFYTANYLPLLCYNADPNNEFQWVRSVEYVSGNNPDSAYIDAFPPTGLPATLAAAGEVMRMRFRLPITPPTPCTDGCSRDGTEQLRYMSLSFEIQGGDVLASLADSAYTKDPNGYVTLIVGTGAAVPSWVTPANGYTYLDLTSFSDYQKLYEVEMRNILRSANFPCVGQVPLYSMYLSMPAGNIMGEYAPVVDYPVAASLPQMASPLVNSSPCATFPKGNPDVNNPTSTTIQCGVNQTPPPTINNVVSECPAFGCTGIVAELQPPINIVGAGFGALPQGMPFTGDTASLEINDTTQGWTAGVGNDVCTVSISSWASNLIQAVANLNALCPLVAGDQVTITVTNPQTGKTGSSTITITAN